ncbi:hypothetical protein CPT_Paso_010 [Rhizobium phage Paso]|uniref:Uncharacterized protein n=1 Tax=Rhizobium phage Paso TaxID=2767574 RepID=A0A7L8G4N2_9CAUD|nr:hypothetical protein CPT_Paso_010 [Rhizobium phage Paso]
MRNIVLTYQQGPDMKKALSAAVFTILAIKATHKYGFNLDAPTAELLAEVETQVMYDGPGDTGGVAFVMKSGEIKCLCGGGGAFDELVNLAKAAGGKWLTCFDIGDIVERYEHHGFYIQEQFPYDPDLAQNVPSWAVGSPVVKMVL